jgi:hypothetical protein
MLRAWREHDAKFKIQNFKLEISKEERRATEEKQRTEDSGQQSEVDVEVRVCQVSPERG